MKRSLQSSYENDSAFLNIISSIVESVKTTHEANREICFGPNAHKSCDSFSICCRGRACSARFNHVLRGERRLLGPRRLRTSVVSEGRVVTCASINEEHPLPGAQMSEFLSIFGQNTPSLSLSQCRRAKARPAQWDFPSAGRGYCRSGGAW